MNRSNQIRLLLLVLVLISSQITSYEALAETTEAVVPTGCEPQATTVAMQADTTGGYAAGFGNPGAGGNREAVADHRPMTHSEMVASALGKPSARQIDFAKSALPVELATAVGVSYVAAHCGR